MNVITNNTPRPVIRWEDLTARERSEFDYYGTEAEQQDAEFFRYKDDVYDLGNFVRIPNGDEQLSQWDGYSGDSWSSGTLDRWARTDYGIDPDYVIAGRYCN